MHGAISTVILRRIRASLHRRIGRFIGASPSVLAPQEWSSWLSVQPSVVPPPMNEVEPAVHELRISCCGPSWLELDPHLWLQYLPLPSLRLYRLVTEGCHEHLLNLQRDSASSESLRLCLNLELPPPEQAESWLAHLQSQQMIWDPDPARVRLMRVLGLSADWLDPKAKSNGWLECALASDHKHWSRLLGLPPPRRDALIVLGLAGDDWNRALASEEACCEKTDPIIEYYPGWFELIVSTVEAGVARAGWLSVAVRDGLRLVVARHDQPACEWRLLDGLKSPPLALGLLDTPYDLRAMHEGGSVKAVAELRVASSKNECFEWQKSGFSGASVAVLVSLYNYSERVLEALESVLKQHQQDLELIVVDDASTDQGAEVVRLWMENCARTAQHPFSRLLLLQHGENVGLAAARNTAFAAATAPWCFVLDADNALYPAAIASCLKLAESASSTLAVVHPLLVVEVESGRSDDQRTLVSTASWQRERLLVGNVVDAMALIRRSAWYEVGGYTHIEGGWEDFDFWCKLLDVGYHGQQCPRVLAVYRSHVSSMSHTATNRSWKVLSSTLQDRHPWLRLPLVT